MDPTASWFVMNVKEVGFYRVNYDTSSWLRLINSLNGKDFALIDEVNRAQLIDDSLNLARAGYIEYDVALNLTTYLRQETSYIPWEAMMTASTYLSQRIEHDPMIKELYRKHVLHLVDEAYKKFGFSEDLTRDSMMEQSTRELILKLACRYDHEDCVKQSVNYYARGR